VKSINYFFKMTDSNKRPKHITLNDDDDDDLPMKWTCTCTVMNSPSSQRCKVCSTYSPLSLSSGDLKFHQEVIDLTKPTNNDRNANNCKWTVASTESARKRKRKMSKSQTRDASTIIIVDDVIEIEEEDVDWNLSSVKSKDNNICLGKTNDTCKSSPQHIGQGQKTVDNSATINHFPCHAERLSVESTSSSLSSKTSNFNKLQSTLFGSILPEINEKKRNKSKTENVEKSSFPSKMILDHDTSFTENVDYSRPIYNHKHKDKEKIYEQSCDQKDHIALSKCPATYNDHKSPITMESFPFSQARHEALLKQAKSKMKSIFGISSLRSLQPIAIDSALKGQSQIIVMATGGGKSLCYQLPAVVLPGVTVVVSPLIALMMDQVEQLKRKGVSAEFICSSQSQKENRTILERLREVFLQQQGQKKSKKSSGEKTGALNPIVKLLYCTPELIQTTRFQDILLGLHRVNMLSLIVIDEAHCMSTWGHDFRPAYRKLSWLRSTFSNVPCMVSS